MVHVVFVFITVGRPAAKCPFTLFHCHVTSVSTWVRFWRSDDLENRNFTTDLHLWATNRQIVHYYVLSCDNAIEWYTSHPVINLLKIFYRPIYKMRHDYVKIYLLLFHHKIMKLHCYQNIIRSQCIHVGSLHKTAFLFNTIVTRFTEIAVSNCRFCHNDNSYIALMFITCCSIYLRKRYKFYWVNVLLMVH